MVLGRIIVDGVIWDRTADGHAAGSRARKPGTPQAFTAVDGTAAVKSLAAFTTLRSSTATTRRRLATERSAAHAALEGVDTQMIKEDSAARARLKEEAATAQALEQEVEVHTQTRWPPACRRTVVYCARVVLRA